MKEKELHRLQLSEIAQAAQKRCDTACEECGAIGDLRSDGGFVFNACELHSRGCSIVPPAH